MKRDLIMARITSIKELQKISDDLYAYFVERLAQVTEIEINGEWQPFGVLED